MAVGLGTIFIGWWVGLFGFASLRGPGVGFIDLIVPGRTVNWPASSNSGNGGDVATNPTSGPGSAEALTCAQIRKLSASQIADILKTNPGFAVTLAKCGFAPPQGAQAGSGGPIGVTASGT